MFGVSVSVPRHVNLIYSAHKAINYAADACVPCMYVQLMILHSRLVVRGNLLHRMLMSVYKARSYVSDTRLQNTLAHTQLWISRTNQNVAHCAYITLLSPVPPPHAR